MTHFQNHDNRFMKKICTTFGSSKILEAKFFFDNWPAFSNEAVAGCWLLCFTALNPDWANIQIFRNSNIFNIFKTPEATFFLTIDQRSAMMLITVFYCLEPWLSTRGQFEPACQTNHVGNTSTYIFSSIKCQFCNYINQEYMLYVPELNFCCPFP